MAAAQQSAAVIQNAAAVSNAALAMAAAQQMAAAGLLPSSAFGMSQARSGSPWGQMPLGGLGHAAAAAAAAHLQAATAAKFTGFGLPGPGMGPLGPTVAPSRHEGGMGSGLHNPYAGHLRVHGQGGPLLDLLNQASAGGPAASAIPLAVGGQPLPQFGHHLAGGDRAGNSTGGHRATSEMGMIIEPSRQERRLAALNKYR